MEAFARTPDRLSSLDFFTFLLFFFFAQCSLRRLPRLGRSNPNARPGPPRWPMSRCDRRLPSGCPGPGRTPAAGIRAAGMSHKGVGCVGDVRNMVSRSTCTTASVGRALLGVYVFEEGRRDLGIRFVRSAASRVSTREMVKRNGTGVPSRGELNWSTVARSCHWILAQITHTKPH